MNDNSSNKLNVWTPFLFALVLILGMTLGFNLRDTLRKKRDIYTIIERNDRLEEIIDIIQQRYVDSVQSNALYEDAITGILAHLDPHTTYISSKELQSVNENLDGSFFGIGVEFIILKDTIQVTAVVEGGPAFNAGLEVGDKLIRVNDSLVAGINITSEGISRKIRGKQYSRVMLTIVDAKNGKLKNVNIKRDAIPIYSIDANLMLDSTTGYIRVNRFSAATAGEFATALESLLHKGMKNLILDLRQNPGGYVDVCIRVANHFFPSDRLIVYTEGNKSPRVDYKTRSEGNLQKGRLAVLVDEGSASASEILAGAIQDWDRGIIVGRRSFGKGLVQEPYSLEDGSSLRLTVARYYIPSGRSIQRPYVEGKAIYNMEIENRYKSGELTGTKSRDPIDTIKFYTSEKRIVYGGGGITPDVYVPYDSVRLSHTLLNILYSEDLKSVIWNYYTTNSRDLKEYKNVQDYAKTSKAEDTLFNLYWSNLPKEEKARIEPLLRKPAYKSYLLLQIKAQLARILFRNNGYYEISLQKDNVVQKALQELKGENYLEIIGRKVVQPH